MALKLYLLLMTYQDNLAKCQACAFGLCLTNVIG